MSAIPATNGRTSPTASSGEKAHQEHFDHTGEKRTGLDGDDITQEHGGWRDDWDQKKVKRILRKMDVHLLPFVSLLYLLSFL